VIAQSNTPEQLFDAIKRNVNRRDISYDLNTYDTTNNYVEGDKMPNFGQILTDAQIWDLVKYLKTAIFDVSQLYNAVYTGQYPVGTASYSNCGLNGNASNGLAYYTSNCGSCHGVDGKLILLENGTLTLGKFLRTKPYEVQHKVKYGNPGSNMPAQFDIALSQMKDLYKTLADTVAFPNQ
jgi:mono/diheme cytochrome c family protein